MGTQDSLSLSYCMTPHMPTMSLLRGAHSLALNTHSGTLSHSSLCPQDAYRSPHPVHQCTQGCTRGRPNDAAPLYIRRPTSIAAPQTSLDQGQATASKRQLLQDSFFKTALSRQYSLVWTKGVCMTSEASDAGPSDAGPSDADPSDADPSDADP